MIKNSFILNVKTKNIIKNYKFFKNINKNVLVAATIKANAYGLGDKKIFNLLSQNGCKHFFVATFEEGLNINNRNKKLNIYVLNGIQNYDLDLFKKFNLTPIINNEFELKRISAKNIKFGVHIDTGINRLGMKYDKVPDFIFKNKNLKIILSHLASADQVNNSYNELQRKRFSHLIKNCTNKNVIFSLANSSGSVISNKYLFDMIRPGIGLYGGTNKNRLLMKKLKPTIKLSGKIIQIKSIGSNEFIGYNQTYKTDKITKIAVIGIGYADGISRYLSNKGWVYYKKNKFNIIGRISMDSFTIDISNSKHNLKLGMFVDLINFDHGIEEFANQCKTISNEIITSIGKRCKIIYE